MDKKEKYKLAFKQSKAKLKVWETEFFAQNQRKPNKDEIKIAPPQIQICYKNCWKIKSYFDSEGLSQSQTIPIDEESQTLDCHLPEEDTNREHITSFSGILTNQSTGDTESKVCNDISNTIGTTGIWGKHLDIKKAKTKAPVSNYEKLSSKLSLQVTTSSTRTSLKKKRSNKSKSFFDTLGDSTLGDSLLDDSQDSLLVPNHRTLSDPSPLLKGDSVSPPRDELLPNVDEGSNEDSCELFLSLPTAKVVSTNVNKIEKLPLLATRDVNPAWLARCGVPGDTTVIPSGDQMDKERLAEVTNSGDQANKERLSFSGVFERTGIVDKPLVNDTIGNQSSNISIKNHVKDNIFISPKNTGNVLNNEEPINVTENKLPYEMRLSPQIVAAPAILQGEGINLEENIEISKSLPPAKTKGKRKMKIVSSDNEDDDDYCEESNKKVTEDIVENEVKSTNKSKGSTLKRKPVKNKSSKLKESETLAVKTKPRSKRKRLSSDDDDDYNLSDDNVGGLGEVGDKIVKQLSKSKEQVRKKKRIKSNDDKQGDDGSVDDLVVQKQEGPTSMNLYALGFEEAGEEVTKPTVKKTMSQQERLESKISSGSANDNYRKIDLKKKSFAKGKNTGAKIKRAEWKRKVAMKDGTKVKEYKCFKCGEVGHFVSQCTGGRGDKLIPTEMAEEFDPGEFPTLDQAAEMATGVLKTTGVNKATLFSAKQVVVPPQGPDADNDHVTETVQTDVCMDFEIADDEALLEAARQFDCAAVEDTSEKFAVAPLHSSKDDIHRALARWGHKDFRPGQEEAILRILSGKSTLVLLATGTGKSLIYQLPALLYREEGPCITLVVSPLVSLMEDQVTGLPPFVNAAALHYNMTSTQKEKVKDQVRSGKLQFLLVSPEAVAGGGGAFGSLLPHLPPIAFVCIDEAHCVSHWSHNFRPSYLRLAKIIRDKLKVKTILGLTATAPESITRSVASHLGVPLEGGVIRGPLLPGNLTLSVSKDEYRDQALVHMLTKGSLAECDSVIVYCTRRDECVRLATVVRTRLQERDHELAERRERKTRVSVNAEPYHAGLSAFRRKTVQNHFMSGRLRVVIATVAFGMGIDKSDIRCIVHYNMPRSFESYIQEIGRAGRDGLPAFGHLFLDNRGGDISELKRHIFSNGMDRHTLRKLLKDVFPKVIEEEDQTKVATSRTYEEVAVSVEQLVEKLDLPEENISTLLCYLESYNPPFIELWNPVYSWAKIQCYGGPRQLRQVASKCPPLAAAIALLRQNGTDLTNASSVEFQVVETSAKMGWSSAIVKKELKNLEWMSTPMGWRKTGILVEFSDLAFHFQSANNLIESELDSLLELLYQRVDHREKSELAGLTRLNQAFTMVSFSNQIDCEEGDKDVRSDKLKSFITEYFVEPERLVPDLPAPAPCEQEDKLRGDVRAFVCQHKDHTWSGRAVARIFHGIQSPNYPAKQWGRVFRSWRSWLDTDFYLVLKIATQEVLSLRQSGF